MIAIIIRKELREMWREGRFRAAALIVFLLLAGALALGVQNYRQTTLEKQTANEADRANWLAQGEKNPHLAAHFGRYAIKPTTALSLFDRGVNQFVGVAVWMEAHLQDSFRFRPAEDATGVARFGELTAATVLQLLVPLLIIVFAHHVFAEERERGTLRQILSLGVSRRRLLLGKALGVAAGLALLLVPAVILGAAALALAASVPVEAEIVPRVAFLILSYLLYFGAILGLTMAVSAQAESSRAALTVLLGLWIAGSLLAPRLAVDAAQTLYPAQHYTEFWAQINKARDEISWRHPNNEHAENLKRETLARYGATKIEDLPINYGGLALQDDEEYGSRIYDQKYAELYATHDRQTLIQTLAGIFTPLVCVRSLSAAFAGTDYDAHRDFAWQAEAHRRRFVKQLNDDLTYNSPKNDWNYKTGAALWRQVPEFVYQPETLAGSLKRQSLSALLLAFWFAGAWLLARVAVARLRVE